LISTKSALLDAFLSNLPDETDPGDHALLSKSLSKALSSARRAWPTVDLSAEVFVAYLASVCTPPKTAFETLRERVTDDLYVACAAAKGIPSAMAAIEERYFQTVSWALRRMKLRQPAMDDVLQNLRTELFADRLPSGLTRISRYTGIGLLAGWLKIIVVRQAGRLIEKEKREVPVLPELADEALVPMGEDAELRQLKGIYREEFRRAFAAALRSLPPDQRTLLRQRYIERVSIDQIGEMHEVHRATAARWVAKASDALKEGVQRHLSNELNVHGATAHSIIQLVCSHVDISLRGMLPAAGGEED
jgi:RNA polymerase sigma-70 factor (ECF subfamily)